MKKLMIAAAIVCAAAYVHAAAAWSVKMSGDNRLVGPSSSTYVSGLAYLFDADSVSQETVFNALDLTKSSLSSDLAAYAATYGVDSGKSFTVTSGAITETTFTGPAEDKSYWMAFVSTDGKTVFFDDEPEVPYTWDTISGATVDLTAGGWSGDSDYDFTAETSWQGTGWYGVQDVPEPTSGLLLLIGMAGLALKRKRA